MGGFNFGQSGELTPEFGPTGISISKNVFDKISNRGIFIGNVIMNSSSFNKFYDVGNSISFNSASPIIDINNANNISFGDLFERDDNDALKDPRIVLNGTAAIAFDSNKAMFLGSYERQSGLEITISDNDVYGEVNLFSIHSKLHSKFKVDYTMTFTKDLGLNPEAEPLVIDQITRIGTFTVTNGMMNIIDNRLGVSFDDEFNETDYIWFFLKATTDLSTNPGDLYNTKVSLMKNLDDVRVTGRDINLKYSITRLD